MPDDFVRFENRNLSLVELLAFRVYLEADDLVPLLFDRLANFLGSHSLRFVRLTLRFVLHRLLLRLGVLVRLFVFGAAVATALVPAQVALVLPVVVDEVQHHFVVVELQEAKQVVFNFLASVESYLAQLVVRQVQLVLHLVYRLGALAHLHRRLPRHTNRIYQVGDQEFGGVKLALTEMLVEIHGEVGERVKDRPVAFSANLHGGDPLLARRVLKVEDLLGVFVFVKPEADLALDEVEANENTARSRVVESLHYLLLAERVVRAQVDVLAADRADYLPVVHSVAECHVRQH
mmetsp:Transcript_13543/g.21103  ORF Transcript_13543/g.21103 Transcript_13543/m.21103 type:complete len:291 (+) Transcript_13543:16775-17647(+)